VNRRMRPVAERGAPKWIWTYRALPEPKRQVMGSGLPRDRDVTFVGWWEHDDIRRGRDRIRIAAAADGRFYPQLPWWDGQAQEPWWDFTRTGSLRRAMALCEAYLGS
jgi:hypothetical protein